MENKGKSLVNVLFDQELVHTNYKENNKALYNWSSIGKLIGDW